MYFVFQFRGALFTGYNKIDWAQTGQKGNLVGTSLIFMNLILLKNLMKQKYKKVLNLKHYFISIEMVFFLTVQVMILSLGTRIYFLISLIAIIMFASIFITKFKTKYVILGTLFLVILISCVGLFRYGFNLSEVNFLSPVNNILQETMLNSFSLIATINFNHWGIIRFPIYLMQDTLNGVLSHLPVHLPAHDPSKAGYPLYSPVGGTSLFYSLIINFGVIGSFIFAFAVSCLLNYLRNTKILYTNAVYVCLSSTLIFTFFRDNFYISIIKVGIQDFVVFPAIVLLTIWCLYCAYHKFFDKNKLKSKSKKENQMKISIIIPTYNPGKTFEGNFEKIEQNIKNVSLESEVVIVDSGSTDGGLDFLKHKNVRLIEIKSSEFNHGGTRNMAAKIANGDLLVYMTQDAVLAKNTSIKSLISPLLMNKKLGIAYGRQLPRKDADVFARSAREFNYPNKDRIQSFSDINNLGIKTIFVSNSFAAYKKDVLFSIAGGFPEHTIFGEDTFVAAKLVLEKYSIAYVADAEVFHSHNYTIMEEFHRYFDIGVFHSKEKWILDRFRAPESEGARFIKYQLKELWDNKKVYLLFSLIFRNGMKYLGYKMGRSERHLPLKIKKRLSMHRAFWDSPTKEGQ
ncbi:glycosyltransferase [Sporolactobacillus inulinus]|uniref:glycosyltransferase n=1 Tax=Sporolactobacillus inulinus TaxID=2078 RepID=UPI0021CCD920|nr:glycosyltransferase [Sporolactobacillus inulinus]